MSCYVYLRQPGEAPLNATLLLRRFLLRCRQISACICSGKLFNTYNGEDRYYSDTLVYIGDGNQTLLSSTAKTVSMYV